MELKSSYFVKTVPSEDYHFILTEYHKPSDLGRRDKLQNLLKNKTLFTALPVIDLFFNSVKPVSLRKKVMFSTKILNMDGE